MGTRVANKTFTMHALSTGLKECIFQESEIMANNTPQTVLTLAAMIGCSSFRAIIETTAHFNPPMLTGPAMSGKTLAATCSAFEMDCNRNQILSITIIKFSFSEVTQSAACSY